MRRQKDIEFLGYTFKNFEAVNQNQNAGNNAAGGKGNKKRPSMAELQETLKNAEQQPVA